MSVNLPSIHDTDYLEAKKIYPTDYLLKALFLWAIPRSVTPNHVTLLRFVLIPPVIILLALHNYQWGVPLFLFTALTDAIDGALARTRNMVTNWGMMFDPLADKLLIIPSALMLIVARLDTWLAAAVIVTEFTIIIAAFIWHNQGKVVQANMWGKVKMLLQVTGIFLLLLSTWLNLPLEVPAATILSASIIFALISLIRHGN